MDYVNLVVLIAMVEYMVFILIVGATRNKYGVAAPATTGNSNWERLYRIQVNTTEQLVLFVPAIYGFAYYVSETWAAGLGSIFLIGRIVYYVGYRKAGDKRIVGAVITTWPSYILTIGALVGLIMKIT